MELFILTLILLSSSCNMKRLQSTEGPLPDTVSKNVKQISISPKRRFEVTADRMENFSSDDYSVFFDVEMQELSGEGTLKSKGRADRIQIHGNRDGVAEGNVSIVNIEEDTRLEADTLSWNDAERTLIGSGSVEVVKENDSTAYGESFVADMAREIYTFSDGVEGEFTVED